MARPAHLFISYASEDVAFSDWLALKLVAEGYEVWYDRMKLLGGEPYPTDIDSAIKNQSFRVLGLVSGYSVSKPNPVKGMTFADKEEISHKEAQKTQDIRKNNLVFSCAS